MSVLGHRLRSLTGFHPSLISGLQIWLDSSDDGSFTYSSGVKVSQWNDRSGNGRHISQGTPANQPSRSGTRNSLATVLFTAANAEILASANFTVAQPNTYFSVIKYSNIDANPHVFLSFGGGSAYTNGGNFQLYCGGAGLNAGNDDANWHYFRHEPNGVSSTIRKDGTTLITGNAGAGGTTKFEIYSDWDGEIAEIFMYDSILSTANRDRVETYLRNKWGF